MEPVIKAIKTLAINVVCIIILIVTLNLDFLGLMLLLLKAIDTIMNIWSPEVLLISLLIFWCTCYFCYYNGFIYFSLTMIVLRVISEEAPEVSKWVHKLVKAAIVISKVAMLLMLALITLEETFNWLYERPLIVGVVTHLLIGFAIIHKTCHRSRHYRSLVRKLRQGILTIIDLITLGFFIITWVRKTSQITGGSKTQGYPAQRPVSVHSMPSGRSIAVNVLTERCSCTSFTATELVQLRPGLSDEYQTVANEMNNTIRSHAGRIYSSYNIVSIYKVRNCCLWTKYLNRRLDVVKENTSPNERLLFHGSAAAADIVQKGFDERHSNLGAMFGAGIYFAEHSSKSNQYVFGHCCPTHGRADCRECERKMLLCRVMLGKEFVLTTANKMANPPCGYHSVSGQPSATGLNYPEYVIYRGEQAYPEYLITYKIT